MPFTHIRPTRQAALALALAALPLAVAETFAEQHRMTLVGRIAR